MRFLPNFIKKLASVIKLPFAKGKNQAIATAKTNDELVSKAKAIIDKDTANSPLKSNNTIIKSLINDSTKQTKNPFVNKDNSNQSNPTLNTTSTTNNINNQDSKNKPEDNSFKSPSAVNTDKESFLSNEAISKEELTETATAKEEDSTIINKEADVNKAESPYVLPNIEKLENKDSTSNSPNQEVLLEQEYQKLKLDLSELEEKPKAKKSLTFACGRTFLFVLKLLTFKWLFSVKLLIVAVLAVAVFIVYILWNLPDYTVLEQYKPSTITRVYSSDGYIISELGLQNRSITSINDIPKVVKDAFTSAEDKTFYTNWGFDFRGIARAAINDTLWLIDRKRTLMGASTITQQVVKNLLLNHDRTITRKAKEAILTIKLEQNLPKDRILELYLNEIYLGNGSYGVTTAALNYFNKSLPALTLPEAAFLAILPRSPNGYNPVTNYDGAKARRDWVIDRMLEDGKITGQEAEEAKATPITLTKRTNLAVDYSSYAAEEVRKQVFNIIPSSTVYSKGLIIKTTINEELQKYAYNALRGGIEKVDELKGYRGPVANALDRAENADSINLEQNFNDTKDPTWLYLLNNYMDNSNSSAALENWQLAIVIKVDKTSLLAGLPGGNEINLNLKDNSWASPNSNSYKLKQQQKTLTDFNNILKSGDIIFVKQSGSNNAPVWKLKQIPKVNGAILVMNPINGYILAMQGGFSYQLSQFNRATQALRQPGSAFKPFVYLAALEKGMTPATLVLDAPYTSQDSNNLWRPKNNSSRYAGYVTMRNALEVSRNLASIRIANFAGLDAISNVAKKLGIYNTNVTNFSEVIGSKETTLLKMTRAYAILANGGKNIDPVLVNKIADQDGQIIYKDDKTECNDCINVIWKNQKVPDIPDTRETIVDPRDAYLITNMLVGVVNRGIGWRGKISGYDIAGKTGTTNDSKDLWFFGFTPQLVVGIFIGEDIPTSLAPVEASSMVVPIFKDFASKALPLLFDKLPFRIPNGIEMSWIDAKTGKPVLENDPRAFLESFRADNMPKGNDQINDNLSGEDTTDYGLY